ncbi:hypothetical protein LJJ44_09150 [Pseudomonas sp. B24_DOA]|jgi:hypothetical protein|uniref:hypothetical protein n=1 Tax=Pseudomonas fluorescens group TaxID=136843 RepID=UPI000879C168|nr:MULTISPECIES: hypothetical protein [Pseudomonas fluorescens group]WKV86026.1 hypothetical protein LJJ44_09150 [Pseudomonas sp. B24_DOA]WKV87454.1 hypothetical protein LJU32_17185 [Pseudomonas sp. B21_DOA]MDR6162307.1 hypothetical protein [Pseudomonas fluorescens]UST60789.1 hypothetical protein NF672_09685 [Pseudomonas moraviensis]UST66005.1 hypothetical protein NF673_09710 [Pseudomonas moraviensis]
MELSRLNELFFENNCVASMRLEMVDFKYNLTLTMSSADDPETEGVTAVFRDVSSLNLSGFGGGLTQFMDLVVTRIDDGLDRIRYELRDIEDEKISFYFFTFSVRDHKE